MKKLLSFLLVLLLIASLSAACFAESPAPLSPRAGSAQSTDETLAPEQAGLSRHASYPSYTRRSNGGVITKMIAAGILCGISALFKSLFGKSGKKDEDQAAQENVILPSEKFICKRCGKGSSGWYQTCPNCGAVGQMVQNKGHAAKPAAQNAAEPSPQAQSTASEEAGNRGTWPEEAARGMSEACASLLSTALKFETDSGMLGYLQRMAEQQEGNDRACLEMLLDRGAPETLRERVKELLALRPQV